MSEIAFRVVKEWDVVRVKITEAVQQRIDLLVSQNRCLGCEEKHQPGVPAKCGQCPTCYQASRRAVKSGRVSLGELIKAGKRLVAIAGRRPINKFTKELASGG